MSRPGPRAPFLRSATLAVLLAVPFAVGAQADDAAGAAPEVVAEALFLADTLPPGSKDFNLVLAVERDATGDLGTFPTLQVAAPLTDRLGFTVDVAIPRTGAMDSPSFSLKVLLRDPGATTTGLSACADVHGSIHGGVDSEVALGLGAIRPVGRVTLRATLLGGSGVSGWTPHLHTGASAAMALSTRVHALAEVVLDARRGGTAVSAGPTMKLALGDKFGVMGGALFALGHARQPLFTIQLTTTM